MQAALPGSTWQSGFLLALQAPHSSHFALSFSVFRRLATSESRSRGSLPGNNLRPTTNSGFQLTRPVDGVPRIKTVLGLTSVPERITSSRDCLGTGQLRSRKLLYRSCFEFPVETQGFWTIWNEKGERIRQILFEDDRVIGKKLPDPWWPVPKAPKQPK